MIATTKLAVLTMTAMIIGVVGISVAAAAAPAAEAQMAIKENGVRADGQIALEAGHWGTVNYINQEACTNEVSQMKAPEDRGNRATDESTDEQVQEVGTQSAECGDVTQSAEINNSVTDESTTNDESTRTSNINFGDPIPDLGQP